MNLNRLNRNCITAENTPEKINQSNCINLQNTENKILACHISFSAREILGAPYAFIKLRDLSTLTSDVSKKQTTCLSFSIYEKEQYTLHRTGT
jgi:hypothetical protein